MYKTFFEEGVTKENTSPVQHNSNGIAVQNIGAGTVQVRTIGECERECDGLRKEIVNLQDKIAMKDEIIASKTELINQLKNK
ncbi:MAG TPA: hypothetical protein DCS19_05040 [Flavobacterium sp.]|nr:hypothetical protein [Flavobacterium sp.]